MLQSLLENFPALKSIKINYEYTDEQIPYFYNDEILEIGNVTRILQPFETLMKTFSNRCLDVILTQYFFNFIFILTQIYFHLGTTYVTISAIIANTKGVYDHLETLKAEIKSPIAKKLFIQYPDQYERALQLRISKCFTNFHDIRSQIKKRCIYK